MLSELREQEVTPFGSSPRLAIDTPEDDVSGVISELRETKSGEVRMDARRNGTRRVGIKLARKRESELDPARQRAKNPESRSCRLDLLRIGAGAREEGVRQPDRKVRSEFGQALANMTW